MFSDTEYGTSPPLSKMFPNPTIDVSPRKLYHDESELPTNSSITKPLTKYEVESLTHKLSLEKLGAPVDISCRRMTKEESLIETAPKKISRDRIEVPIDTSVRRGLSNELEAECTARKAERNIKGDLMDNTSRNIYRERSDLSLDVRKILWNELESSSDVARRKISRDMMGSSIDSASRKVIQDDVEHAFDSVSRRITRESMGISLDTGSKILPWTQGEFQSDSSGKALAIDKTVEAARTPLRKISRDELQYYTDTASLKMSPREKKEALMDTPTEKKELGLESSTSRKIQKDDIEMPDGSLRRRMLRIPIDESDSSIHNPTGKIPWDRVHAPMEIHKKPILREELGAFESNVAPGHIGQPDLMVTSQVPWMSSSDLFPVGPLSQLVYDGILEKCCNSMSTTSTSISASTSNLPQSKLQAEEPLLLSSKVAFPSPASPPEIGDERIKDKEKSKKSLKLKNPFKKSTQEKPQSGLQKL